MNLLKNKLLTILIFSITMNYLHGDEGPRIGLALGGGGALGYAHIGVLRVLEEYNIPVHVVSGTSAGAIVGALYALGYRPAEIEALIVDIDFLSIVDDKKSRRVADTRTKMHPWSAMLGSTFYQSEEKGRKSDFSIFKGYLIDNFFDYLYWDGGSYRNFGELPRPFAAIATDTVTNKKLVIKDGPLGKAVRASMAIPLIITPEYYDGHAVVDGGVVNNLPVEDAFNLGADIVIAIDVGNKKNKKNGAVSLLLQQRISNDRRAREMATVLISPDLGNYTSASFNRAKELIEMGALAAIAALPELLKYARIDSTVINKPLITAPTINKVEIVGTLRPALIEKLLNIEAPSIIGRDKALAHVELVSRHIYVSQLHYFYNEDTLFIEIREYTGTKIGANASYNTDFGAKLSGGIEIREMQLISLFFQGHLSFHQGLESSGLVYLFPEQYPWLNYLFSWNLSDNFGQGVRYPDSSILPKKRQPNHYNIATGVAITVGNYFYFSTLYQYHHMNTNAILDQSYYDNIDSEHATSLKEKIVIDYLDSNRYPTTGIKAFLSMEQGLPPFNYFKYWRVHSGIRGAITLPVGFSIGLSTEGGFLMGKKAPQMSYFSVGGMYTEEDYIYMQGFTMNTVKGRSLWLARSNIMYSIASRFHIIAEWNGAFISETQRLMFDKSNFYQTTGLKAAADFTPFLVEASFFWNITQSKFLFGLILGSSY